MTMFIKLENGEPVGNAIVEENFRMLFPGISFSWPFIQEDVEQHGFGIYDFSEQPECGVFEKLVEGTPVKDETGRWRQKWHIEPMTQQERDERIEREWIHIRYIRDMRLGMSDWTQMVDNHLSDEKKAEWASYRQALRDITTQTDPFNITWPTKPE